MGLSDRLKRLTKATRDTAAQHKSEVESAVEKAAALADQRTQGRYHDHIAQAKGRADTYVDRLAAEDEPDRPGEADRPTAPDTPDQR